MRPIRQIIIHQSDTVGGTLESIRRHHRQARGWDDIGYHYVIERDAAVKKGRNNSEIGAHCRGDNEDSIGICLVGRGEALPLDDGYCSLPMFLALMRLVRDLQAAYPTITQVWGHREKPSGIAQGKTCPGFDAGVVRALVLGEG